MGHHRFKLGDRVTILWDRYESAMGVVDSAAVQRTVDFLDECAGYNVVLDTVEAYR